MYVYRADHQERISSEFDVLGNQPGKNGSYGTGGYLIRTRFTLLFQDWAVDAEPAVQYGASFGLRSHELPLFER